jgi:hypothetical protein
MSNCTAQILQMKSLSTIFERAELQMRLCLGKHRIEQVGNLQVLQPHGASAVRFSRRLDVRQDLVRKVSQILRNATKVTLYLAETNTCVVTVKISKMNIETSGDVVVGMFLSCVILQAPFVKISLKLV